MQYGAVNNNIHREKREITLKNKSQSLFIVYFGDAAQQMIDVTGVEVK